MVKSKKPDNQSMGLFAAIEGDGAYSEPGLGEAQQKAKPRSDLVLNQPMQSVALKPKHGAITKAMNLLFMRIIQEVQQQPEQQTYNIPLRVLTEFIGDSSHYKRLKDNLRALNVVQVEWNNVTANGEEWGVSTLLSQAKFVKKINEVTLEVALAPDINKGVREMRQFSALNLLIAREFNTAPGLALYKIAVAYETNPSHVTFRTHPGEWEIYLKGSPRDPGTTFEYKYFKRDVLLPAIAEVNELAHFTLELIEFRQGRTVTEIQFRITPKALAMTAENFKGTRADDEALSKLKALGVRMSEALSLIATWGAERVGRNADFTVARRDDENAKKLKRTDAYVKAAILNDYASNGAEVTNADVTLVTPDRKTHKDQAADKERAMMSFKAHRRGEAETMFMEMIRRDSEKYWSGFIKELADSNNQTLLSMAKAKHMESRMVKIAFLDWLADKLLGAITDAKFMEFLVSMASQPVRARKKAA